MPIFSGFFGAFFSTKCLGCGLETPFLGMCPACLTRLTPREGAFCPCCGALLQVRENRYPCGACVRRRPDFDRVFGVFDYLGPAGRAIAFGKYRRCPEAIDWVARQVVRHIPNELCDDPPDAVVWVPSTWRRIKARGFRPPQLIAHRVAKRVSVPLVDRTLTRHRHTREQAGLDMNERRRNVRQAFSVTGPLPRDLLLIDDVFTTGSTVSEISRVLRREGVERIRVLTACYVDDSNAHPVPMGGVNESIRPPEPWRRPPLAK